MDKYTTKVSIIYRNRNIVDLVRFIIQHSHFMKFSFKICTSVFRHSYYYYYDNSLSDATFYAN